MRCKLSCLLLVLAAAPALRAQDTIAILKGTSLTLKGSVGVDDITIGNAVAVVDGDTPTPVDVLVTPNNGATLNGSTDPVTFQNVLKLKILLGNGSDVLHFTDFDFASNPVTLNAGPGDDQVILANTTTGSFKFNASSGNDTFDLTNTHLGSSKIIGGTGLFTMPADNAYFHDLKLTTGPEGDLLTWTNLTTVDFFLKLNTGAGNDHFSSSNCILAGNDAAINLSAGNDVFSDDAGTVGNFLSIVGGSGDDHVTLEDTTVGNDFNLKLNSGENQVDLQSQDETMVVGNSCTITGGGTSDTVRVHAFAHSVIFGNNLTLALKAGVNELDATGDWEAGDDLLYTGGGGDDVVDLHDGTIGGNANVVLKGGFNDVILTDVDVGLDLRITAGNGDDTVQLLGATTVGGNTLIHLGGGNNTQP
jgi:hypothetical protein